MAVLHFARRALEEFPGQRGDEQVRVVAGAGAVLLLGIGLGL